MDLDDMTIEELQTLAVRIQSRLAQLAQQQAEEADSVRADITQAVTTLDQLIGDGVTTPDESTIVGIQLHSDETIGANAVLAIRLLMQGLEITARSARDIARVVGK